MAELILKRGSGRNFDGENWKLAAEKKWEVQELYVPNGKEQYMGNRAFDAVEHAVFRCLNDEFFAQPVHICELPKPEDPMEVIYSLDAPEIIEKATPSKAVIQGTKVLTFMGKNWKLAAEKKWKSTSTFSNQDNASKVGEKTIGQTVYDVFRTSGGFVAVKQ